MAPHTSLAVTGIRSTHTSSGEGSPSEHRLAHPAGSVEGDEPSRTELLPQPIERLIATEQPARRCQGQARSSGPRSQVLTIVASPGSTPQTSSALS
jgi:hypothetical protein